MKRATDKLIAPQCLAVSLPIAVSLGTRSVEALHSSAGELAGLAIIDGRASVADAAAVVGGLESGWDLARRQCRAWSRSDFHPGVAAQVLGDYL